MGTTGGVYRLFFLLHILGIMAGLGPTFLAPAFATQARARRGREGLAIAETTFRVIGDYAQWVIYTIPITGIILVLVSDDAWQFSDTWISLSFLLYIVALGVVHAVHFPNLRRMNELMAGLAAGTPPSGGSAGGPPPQVAELEERGKRAAAMGGVLNVLTLLILILMIWKPGT